MSDTVTLILWTFYRVTGVSNIFLVCDTVIVITSISGHQVILSILFYRIFSYLSCESCVTTSSIIHIVVLILIAVNRYPLNGLTYFSRIMDVAPLLLRSNKLSSNFFLIAFE